MDPVLTLIDSDKNVLETSQYFSSGFYAKIFNNLVLLRACFLLGGHFMGRLFYQLYGRIRRCFKMSIRAKLKILMF